MVQAVNIEFPGLDCGMCGYRTCDELREQLPSKPDLVKRCIHLSENRVPVEPKSLPVVSPSRLEARETSCGTCTRPVRGTPRPEQLPWHDSLGREFDFYLEHFPEEPGPRDHLAAQPAYHPRDGDPGGRHSHWPAAGHVVWLPDYALRRGDGSGSADGRHRMVRDRTAWSAAKGVQGSRLLHCRGLRGFGQRSPLRVEGGHALLLPTASMHAAVAAQRPGELSQPQWEELPGAGGRTVDRVAA